MRPGAQVVDWGEAPDHVPAPGPNTANYHRFRESTGAHLIFNIFLKIQHFCVHQMLMREPMHQIDLGAIVLIEVHLVRAILHKFNEGVQTALDKSGLAAKRLGQRFRLYLAKCHGKDGQRYVLSYTPDYFRYILINSELLWIYLDVFSKLLSIRVPERHEYLVPATL